MKKTLLLFVVLLGTIVLLCSCDCKHEAYSQANCTEPSICLKCGETVSNALGHSDGEWITDKEPNCTEDGSKHQICSVCNDTIKNETLIKLEHTDSEWIIDKEASCSATGTKHKECSVCHIVLENAIIDKIAHTPTTDDGVAPTCNSTGLLEGSHCSVCKEILVKQEVVNATGHIFGNWTQTDAPTCTEEGTERRYCNNCQYSESKPIKATKHTWASWAQTQAPTCTEKGIKRRNCEFCEHYEIKEIDAIGHTDGEWIIDKEANCTEDGSKHQICSVCEATIKTETLTKLGHTDGEWITDKEANCTEDESKHQICSVCEATIKTETLTKLGHTDGEWITDKEANCTEDGSKHQVCSVCNDTIETEVIPAAGHEYAKTVTKATAESNASILFTCKTCMYSYTEIISPINVIVELTGSGVTISGSVYYSRSFEVTANGGFGKYQYRFESGSNLLQDYTTDNTITVYGNSLIDYATIKITVTDEIGQKTVYEIKGNGSYVNSYVVYE